MYIEPKPNGYQTPDESTRMLVWKASSGDDLVLSVYLTIPNHSTPVTPENSKVTFVLAEDRFDTRKIWTGTWFNGIEPVASREGLITIRIDETAAARLRRGGYSFSIQVSDRFGQHKTTVLSGTLLVEYEPTSDQHSIPYRAFQETSY